MLNKIISILMISFLCSAVTLDIGIISQGNGTYETGDMWNDANEDGIWNQGEEVYDDTVEIILTNDTSVRGFQFDINGISAYGGFGGLAEANGFDVYAAENTALGFSFNGNVIPATSDSSVLTTLYGIITDDVCLPFVQENDANVDTPVLSDENGLALNVMIEDDINCHLLSIDANLMFNLFETYPNPFNPELNININIDQNSYVDILVYNINGQLINTIYSGIIAGNQLYHFTWDASNISSGIYIVKIDSDNFIQSRIVNLLK